MYQVSTVIKWTILSNTYAQQHSSAGSCKSEDISSYTTVNLSMPELHLFVYRGGSSMTKSLTLHGIPCGDTTTSQAAQAHGS